LKIPIDSSVTLPTTSFPHQSHPLYPPFPQTPIQRFIFISNKKSLQKNIRKISAQKLLFGTETINTRDHAVLVKESFSLYLFKLQIKVFFELVVELKRINRTSLSDCGSVWLSGGLYRILVEFYSMTKSK
jgi:hypothetical protein